MRNPDAEWNNKLEQNLEKFGGRLIEEYMDPLGHHFFMVAEASRYEDLLAFVSLSQIGHTDVVPVMTKAQGKDAARAIEMK